MALRTGPSWAGLTCMPRSLPPSRKVKISFGCLRPEAHSLQFLRVQGERVSVSEPLATGHSAASFLTEAPFDASWA